MLVDDAETIRQSWTAIRSMTEVALHQTLLSELIHGLKQPDVQPEALFTDRRWRLVCSFAPRQS